MVHGGLFHAKDAQLEDLNAISRVDFSLSDLPEGGEAIDEIPRYELVTLGMRWLK